MNARASPATNSGRAVPDERFDERCVAAARHRQNKSNGDPLMTKRPVAKFLSRLALGVALSSTALSAFAGAVLDRVQSSKQLVVAVSAKWPPHAFLNDNHQLAGFDIDVANDIARRLGVNVKFDTPDFHLVTGGHWQGRWDLAVYSITPTKARARVLNFPAIYFYSKYVFVVHKDSKAKTPEDLKNVTFGVEGGTTADDYMHRDLQLDANSLPPFRYLDYTPKTIITYKTSLLPFEDLRLGDNVRLGAILTEEQTAETAIEHGYPVKIIPNDVAFLEPVAIVSDKGDPDFDKKLAAIVNDMKQDGTLKKISQKWYGKDYTQPNL
jgi:polar amino acid transport system substrate-binding protein